VEIVGIYRAQGIRLNQNMRTMRNIYRTYIDVIGYVKSDEKRYENKPEEENQVPVDPEMQEYHDMADNDEADHALDNKYDKGFTDD
jgi:hypothetical protein